MWSSVQQRKSIERWCFFCSFLGVAVFLLSIFWRCVVLFFPPPLGCCLLSSFCCAVLSSSASLGGAAVPVCFYFIQPTQIAPNCKNLGSKSKVVVALAFLLLGRCCIPCPLFLGGAAFSLSRVGGAVSPSSFAGGVVFLSLLWMVLFFSLSFLCVVLFPLLLFLRRVVCFALLWVVLFSSFPVWVVLLSLHPSLECCCSPPLVLLGVVFSRLLSSAALGGPTFQSFFGVVFPLFGGAGFSSPLFVGVAPALPPSLRWWCFHFLSFLRWCCGASPFACHPLSLRFHVGGAAFFLFLWVVLFRWLAFGSSWGLTIVEGWGRREVRTLSLLGRWFLVCCFFCFWCFVSCWLGLWALALSLSLTLAMVALLGGSVLLIGFWVVLGTSQFGPCLCRCPWLLRWRPLSGWCCFSSRSFVCLLFPWSGTAFVGAAVPSSIGVVLLSPLHCCCFLLGGGGPRSLFLLCCAPHLCWCCLPSSPFGGAAFSSSFCCAVLYSSAFFGSGVVFCVIWIYIAQIKTN